MYLDGKVFALAGKYLCSEPTIKMLDYTECVVNNRKTRKRIFTPFSSIYYADFELQPRKKYLRKILAFM